MRYVVSQHKYISRFTNHNTPTVEGFSLKEMRLGETCSTLEFHGWIPRPIKLNLNPMPLLVQTDTPIQNVNVFFTNVS